MTMQYNIILLESCQDATWTQGVIVITGNQ